MQNCTIFLKNKLPENVLELFDKYDEIDVSLSTEKAHKVIVNNKDNQMTISVMERVERGDQFSRTVLGLYNFIKQYSDRSENKSLTDVLETVQILGITINTDFDHFSIGNQIIVDLSKKFTGMIFDGCGVLDWEGNLLAGE